MRFALFGYIVALHLSLLMNTGLTHSHAIRFEGLIKSITDGIMENSFGKWQTLRGKSILA